MAILGLSTDELMYLDPHLPIDAKVYIGIDPGLSGAIAILDRCGDVIEIHDMPTMAKGNKAKTVKRQVNGSALVEILRDYPRSHVTLEGVSARPGQGVSSMFSLGDSLGVVRGVVAALEMSLNIVPARVWKQYYKLNNDKELSRTKAIQLYPSVSLGRKKDADRAEALLLARYGWEHGVKQPYASYG